MDKLVCAYCGKVKEEVSFYIGASKDPDWVMVEGTGKIACPGCWERASLEGQEVIRKVTKL